jgi:hypothetical protein
MKEETEEKPKEETTEETTDTNKANHVGTRPKKPRG